MGVVVWCYFSYVSVLLLVGYGDYIGLALLVGFYFVVLITVFCLMVCFCLDLGHKSLLFDRLQWLGLVGVAGSSDLVLILLGFNSVGH